MGAIVQAYTLSSALSYTILNYLVYLTILQQKPGPEPGQA
jgi:hypothetical protein